MATIGRANNAHRNLMTVVKELTVYSVGDSRRLSSWSNVPFFFTETLIAKGIKVNRVNLERTLAGKLLDKTVWKLLNFVNRNTYYSYSRSLVHYLLVRSKIARALARYPRTDANIFLTFSHSSAGMTDKPTVLFCDWTYDHHFRYFLGQPPNAMESMAIAREDQQIEDADLVCVLFPRVAEYMKQRYRNPKIHYLGNVVNSLLDVSDSEVLARKSASTQLLFIGGSKYLEGARQLIETYKKLKTSRPGLMLNIVGMRAREFSDLPAGVKCHGYLDKENTEQRTLYYELLVNAKVVVNTTPRWGAFSATLEAMHCYTPVITTPYPEFIETFGEDLDFGCYCNSTSTDELQATIKALLDNPAYAQLCLSAHDAVKDCSWGAFIDKMLVKIDQAVVARQPNATDHPQAIVDSAHANAPHG